ncbi:putative enterotoxin [Ophiocordyceps australis]|uniref:Putative enterotoxin n=1 Tax=Ophiocordyceps australis TaxID=1399860 RepID=A0A2C5YFQ2_9HYPO|nr:putative enterotoxin [Ophiocordyceps australis]
MKTVPDRSETGVFYRGDSRSPDYIFRHGFEPQGTNMNLRDHLSFAGNSGFVSVSRSRPAVRRYVFGRSADGHTTGYLYIIAPHGVPRGYWLPEMYSRDGPVQRNQEFAVAGHIPGGSIAGAFVFQSGNWDNPTTWLPNSNYAYQRDQPFNPENTCLGRLCRIVSEALAWVCVGTPDPCIRDENERFISDQSAQTQVEQPIIDHQPIGQNNPAFEACNASDEEKCSSKSNSVESNYLNTANTAVLAASCLASLKSHFKRSEKEAATRPLIRDLDCSDIIDAWAYKNDLDCRYAEKKAHCTFSSRRMPIEEQMFKGLTVRAVIDMDWFSGTSGPIHVNFGNNQGTTLFESPDPGDSSNVTIDMRRVFGADEVALKALRDVEIYHSLHAGYWSASGGRDQFKIKSIEFEIHHVASDVKLLNDEYKDIESWMGQNSRVWPKMTWAGALNFRNWHVDLS